MSDTGLSLVKMQVQAGDVVQVTLQRAYLQGKCDLKPG